MVLHKNEFYFNRIYNFLSDITEGGNRRRDEGRNSRQVDSLRFLLNTFNFHLFSHFIPP